jgi:lipoprotein-anchoring transpeptidase ErfK/SrfK
MSERLLRISLTEQRLDLVEGRDVVASYSVSTSKYGAGEQAASFKTPRGRHIVRAKIGAGQPLGAVFVGRRPTGEIHTEVLARAEPDRDWILSRILWLSGTEVGKNRLGRVDSMRRYIYIHGTPDCEPLGEPRSIGCIRMSNADVVELFDLVAVGTPVEISE